MFSSMDKLTDMLNAVRNCGFEPAPQHNCIVNLTRLHLNKLKSELGWVYLQKKTMW